MKPNRTRLLKLQLLLVQCIANGIKVLLQKQQYRNESGLIRMRTKCARVLILVKSIWRGGKTSIGPHRVSVIIDIMMEFWYLRFLGVSIASTTPLEPDSMDGFAMSPILVHQHTLKRVFA